MITELRMIFFRHNYTACVEEQIYGLNVNTALIFHVGFHVINIVVVLIFAKFDFLPALLLYFCNKYESYGHEKYIVR